jgi:pimeloyl-ACP methyl ester carboxylesterase
MADPCMSMRSSALSRLRTAADAASDVELTVDGVSSPVTDIGPRAGEAVVFVHGNPGSRLDWAELAAATSQFARTVALDMPGYGQAAKPADFDYTVAGYARHLGGALDQLGLSRVHLVLHDFGGAWGLAWAAGHPDRIGSVTLINIGILPGYRWHYLARIWRMPVIGEIVMATATRTGFGLLLNHGNPRGLPKAFIDRMFADFDRGTRRAVLRLYRATSDLDRLSRIAKDALGGSPLPVLVVWGKHDPYVPVRYAERQREWFPNAEVKVLEDSGHWPFADNPDAVADAVIPFLRRRFSAPAGLELEP